MLLEQKSQRPQGWVLGSLVEAGIPMPGICAHDLRPLCENGTCDNRRQIRLCGLIMFLPVFFSPAQAVMAAIVTTQKR